MQIENKILVNELLLIIENSIQEATKFKTLPESQLNFKVAAEKWSILECFEHLNLYGDFYLPEIEKRILENKNIGKSLVFKSGILGNYFANLMKEKNGKIKKMKTPKDKNPINSKLTMISIDRFLKQAERIKTLLKDAENLNLSKVKTSISLSRFIKLRLGDTFRFYVYHIERHVKQAESIR